MSEVSHPSFVDSVTWILTILAGRTPGRPSFNQEDTDTYAPYNLSRAPSVSSTSTNRRVRGFQPAEVNKKKRLNLENEIASKNLAVPSTQEAGNQPQSHAFIDENLEVPVTPTERHRESSAATETSVQIIVNDSPQRSCWSRAMPDEPPSASSTQWDNTIVDVDNPEWNKPSASQMPNKGSVRANLQNLPPYRFPGSKAAATIPSPKRVETSSAADSFKRQLAGMKKGAQSSKTPANFKSETSTYAQALETNAKSPEGPSTEKHDARLTAPTDTSQASPHLLKSQLKPQDSREIQGSNSKANTTIDHPLESEDSHKRFAASEEDMSASKKTVATMKPYTPPHARGVPTPKANTPKSGSTPLLRNGKHAVPPVVNIDEELAAAQGVEDTMNDAEIAKAMAATEQQNTDEQIAAALQAEYAKDEGKSVPPIQTELPIGSRPQQPTTLPPHLRPKTSKTIKSQPKLLDPVEVTETNGHQNHAANGASKDFSKGRGHGKGRSQSSSGGAVINEQDQPQDVTGLRGWDGKMAPAPLGDDWDNRAQHDSRGRHKHAVIKTWAEDHAAEPGNVLAEDPEKWVKAVHHPKTLPNPDEFTQVKRHLKAADHIEAFEARRSVSGQSSSTPEKGRMTKEQRREHRRLMAEEDKKRLIPPNEHAPAANIYLRPAEMQDMRQVAWIHNWWTENTPSSFQLVAQDEVHWRERFQEAYDEGDPFLVAVHMGSKTIKDVRDVRRKKAETIVGFAFAADYGLNNTAYRYTVELEIWVHYEHLRQGIGRTMLDRMLASLDPGYNLLDCVPLLGNYTMSKWTSGGHRIVKTILCNLHHNKETEKDLQVRRKWLTNNNFQDVGTLPISGWKLGKA